MSTNERQRIAVVEKALKVLEAFGPTTPELKLDEIAQLTGINKSSCQRLTHTLEKIGYLRRNVPQGSFHLTSRCLSLSFSYLRFHQTLQLVSPHLSRLAAKTGLRVDLTFLDGNDVVFMSRVPSRVESFNISPVGRRNTALSSASGRILLAYQDPARIEDVFNTTELKQLTPKTILQKSKIRNLLIKARTDGYAYQLGEVLDGAASLAAPIMDESGSPVAAISIGTTVIEMMDDQRRESLVQELLRVTQGLSNIAMPV